MHLAKTLREIALVQHPYPGQMGAQRLDQAFRQHRHAVSRALPVAHRDLVALEIDILHAQSQTLQ